LRKSVVTNVKCEVLRWNLRLLLSVKCVETEDMSEKVVCKLTKAGRVIEFMERKA